MKKKGQVSIEFVLLLVIMLIFVQIMIQPILDTAVQSSEEISQLGQVKAAAEKLTNSVDFISLSSGNSKQTVSFYLPPTTLIRCSPATKEFNYSAAVNITHEACQNDADGDDLRCTRKIPIVGSSQLNCVGFGSGLQLSSLGETGRYYDIAVRKVGDTVYVES